MSPIILQDINKLTPADYNPRKVDTRRLAIVRLSLLKLGWLLPIYTTPDGHILSGHQRLRVAREMGFTRVPVSTLVPRLRKGQTLDQANRCLNILFNRATNDMELNYKASLMAKELLEVDFEPVACLSSRKVNTMDSFRCMSLKPRSVRELLAGQCRSRQKPDYFSTAKAAHNQGIRMPVVVTERGRVVNGIGRLMLADFLGESTLGVVQVTEEEAYAAETFLNLLSMDFDVEAKYGDILRHNSFRRQNDQRDHLGEGFVFALPQKLRTNFDHTTHAAVWKKTYGHSVLDFGAGHRNESAILQSIGVNVLPFEPYCLARSGKDSGVAVGVTNEIDLELSRQVVRNYLQAIGRGMTFSSIFLSSVLQSVPFQQDRRHILALIHAVSSSSTKFYCVAKSISHAVYQAKVKGISQAVSKRDEEMLAFRLDHEDGVVLTEFTSLPKIQKFYSQEEFEDLLGEFYFKVLVDCGSVYIYGTASRPRNLDKKKLRAAIEFEFDLPYPGNKRMGLVKEALEAFTRRGCL